MEKTLFSFIWKYSRTDQIKLLILTLLLFPLLYITLDLPKRIINDAIGADGSTVDVFGIEMAQLTLLAILCVAFLLSVIAHGLLKMRINTMKGITAERMLQRFRFALINRIVRFPKPYFQRVSQGELVSMVTAESEPMGGMMGDAISQPVMQAGQMLTILGFLFLQSFWFGLASIALIPLQAWLIPKLQRQINKLNKERIGEVRQLATEVGETAAGTSSLRTDGGWLFRLAQIRHRLELLFDVRYRIYRKKFFMKFLNNLIGQLTPFFFFSIGGYLVIQGSVTIGALVAALAAYKDLSSPWKELLTYYNQIQEMSQRWTIITERFAPAGIIDEDKVSVETAPSPLPALRGPLEMADLTVTDANGLDVLKNLTLSIPGGAHVGIRMVNGEERRALCEVLTREIQPSSGSLRIADQPVSELHQATLAARIGVAGPAGLVFRGQAADNFLMALMTRSPGLPEIEKPQRDAWIANDVARFDSPKAMRSWGYELIETLDPQRSLFQRSLSIKPDTERYPGLSRSLVKIRPVLAEKIVEAGLRDAYYRFIPTLYNPALTIIGNLLFALPKQPITQDVLIERKAFLDLLDELELKNDLVRLALDVVDLLLQTFGQDGTDHPLFRQLELDAETFLKAGALANDHRNAGTNPTEDEDVALLLSIPFQVSTEQIGAALPDDLKERVLELRAAKADQLLEPLRDLFEPLDEDQFTPGLDVVENALFGRISKRAGSKSDALKTLITDTLIEAGLRRPVSRMFEDIEIDLEGRNLPSSVNHLICLCRAALKRPDLLILDTQLAHLDEETRSTVREKLKALLPDSTIIYLEPEFEAGAAFDMTLEITDGRVPTDGVEAGARDDSMVTADLQEKVRVLQSAPIFSTLDRKQLRLLAFGAQWYKTSKDSHVFHANDSATDGAYLIVEGTAGLYRPTDSGPELVAEASSGVVVGELGLISGQPRKLDFKAHEDLRALRIGEEEFLTVVKHDAATAFKLLQVVTSYLDAPGPGKDAEDD